jgi:threonyl-tRNA synthetase
LHKAGISIKASGHTANPLFIVLAREQRYVKEKIKELENMQVPYLIVCGERTDHPKVVYIEARVSGMQLTLQPIRT